MHTINVFKYFYIKLLFLFTAITWFPVQLKLVTLVESDPKAPFSIATTTRCMGGRYSIPRFAPLQPWFSPYSAECWARLSAESLVSRVSDLSRGWPKAPFSIAASPRCRKGATPFQGLLRFTHDPHLSVLSTLVWLNLGLNPGLQDHWRTLYSTYS